MYKKVDTKLDFAGREPEVAKFWKDKEKKKQNISLTVYNTNNMETTERNHICVFVHTMSKRYYIQ